MTVKDIMERVSIGTQTRTGIETGRVVAYIKEALNEMAVQSPTHTKTERMDIVKDQRFYTFPNHAFKILDIRCKNHDNGDDEYRSVPRSIHEPYTKDSDGV